MVRGLTIASTIGGAYCTITKDFTITGTIGGLYCTIKKDCTFTCKIGDMYCRMARKCAFTSKIEDIHCRVTHKLYIRAQDTTYIISVYKMTLGASGSVPTRNTASTSQGN